MKYPSFHPVLSRPAPTIVASCILLAVTSCGSDGDDGGSVVEADAISTTPGLDTTGTGTTEPGPTGAPGGDGNATGGGTGAGSPNPGSTGTGNPGAGSTGAGSTGAGSTGAGSTGAGSTGAGSTGAGSTGPSLPPTSTTDSPAPPTSMPGGMGSSGVSDPQGSGGAPPQDDAGDNDEGPGDAGGAPSNDGPSGSADAALPSAGCGQAPPSSDRYTIDVGGLSREYIISVPSNYDPDTAYRLVFTWHPWGGSAQQVAGNGPSGYYGLLGASDGAAILVSPEGLDFGGNGKGWGNENGRDLDFMRAMIDRFDAELCFDHNRIFSTGFSFGGMMSNAVGCSGLARAIAPMAGNSMVAGCENGSQPVAFMGFHGASDDFVTTEGGRVARDIFIQRNGCGGETPSESDYCAGAGANPCTCTSYQGCQEGYPVTWCEFAGGHTPAPNSGGTIWNFFAQF